MKSTILNNRYGHFDFTTLILSQLEYLMAWLTCYILEVIFHDTIVLMMVLEFTAKVTFFPILFPLAIDGLNNLYQ